MGKEEEAPFHMQDLDDNVAVLPKDADISPEYEPEQSTVVDIGSIQTEPKTSTFSSALSIT